MKILITGGAGYIGSHTLVELEKSGYDFVVFDNLSNSSKTSLKRVEQLINKSIIFEQGDIRDKQAYAKEVWKICTLIVGEGKVKTQMVMKNNNIFLMEI